MMTQWKLTFDLVDIKCYYRDINVTSQWPSTTKKWTFVQNSEKSPQNTQEIVLTRIGHTHEQAAVINAYE